MAGLPGGGRGPGGVPKFVSAPATQPVGDSTTYIARGASVTPAWGAWRKWHAFADWIQQGIKTVAAPTQLPFNQYNWPNPRAPVNLSLYQKWTDYYSIQIIPLVLIDWPNPRGPDPRHVGYQGWIDYSTSPAGATPPDTTHILRAPVYTPRWSPYRIETLGFVQGTTLTLRPVVVVQAPFAQGDWPIPRGWPRPHVGFASGINLGLLRPDVNPFLPWDWANPQLPRRSIDLLTWKQSPAVPPPSGAPPPIRLYDWPNPRGWPRPHVGFVHGETLLQPPPPTRTSDCLLLLEDSSGNLILEDFLGLLALELCGPFVTYDLALPPRALGPRQDWVQNAYAARNTAVVVTKPFLQTDWANPRGPVSAHYGFGFGTNVGLLRPGVNPEINYDWPNPQPARRVVADWIQSAFAALQTSPPAPQPFNQTDWPVTLGRVGSHVGFTAATQLGLLRPDVNPFIPRDFANPKAPQRGVDLYGWIQALTALVIPPPPPPTFPPNGQYNWPNPAGPVRGIDLWGWSQPVTALNLPPTIIPPPEVLQPGGRGVPHTFSRKRWRELQMLIAAEMAAVAKAEEVTKRGKREALLQAARAAAAAVDAAEAEGENKRLDKLLVRNALTLRAAIRAASEVKLLRETASAIEQSRAIVQRQQDEEDEMINLLMLS